jgi:hypothetical protein
MKLTNLINENAFAVIEKNIWRAIQLSKYADGNDYLQKMLFGRVIDSLRGNKHIVTKISNIKTKLGKGSGDITITAKVDVVLPDSAQKGTKNFKYTQSNSKVKGIIESVNEAYDIGMARKGNGIIVYNKAEEENNDYKKVAHIDNKGKIKYHDKKLPPKIKKTIEAEAKKMMEIKSEGTKMKLKGLLNESSVQVGKVYSNPYAKSWVKEEDERQSTEEMTEEQRSAFLEAVKGYRTYGEAVYRKEGLTKVYESIRNMVEVANKVTLSETGDWFDGVTVGRHMKRMNESFKVFEKTLKEVSTLQQRLESSYDEIGEVLGKYYEINELEEGNEFGAARAKAIAAGKSEFEVDGKTYKVTGVDKEDKENAKKFANEGTEMKLTDLLNEDVYVKNKQTGNVYKVKNANPAKHEPPSKGEIEKAKADQSTGGGDTSPKSKKSSSATFDKPSNKWSSGDFNRSAKEFRADDNFKSVMGNRGSLDYDKFDQLPDETKKELVKKSKAIVDAINNAYEMETKTADDRYDSGKSIKSKIDSSEVFDQLPDEETKRDSEVMSGDSFAKKYANNDNIPEDLRKDLQAHLKLMKREQNAQLRKNRMEKVGSKLPSAMTSIAYDYSDMLEDGLKRESIKEVKNRFRKLSNIKIR